MIIYNIIIFYFKIKLYIVAIKILLINQKIY